MPHGLVIEIAWSALNIIVVSSGFPQLTDSPTQSMNYLHNGRVGRRSHPPSDVPNMQSSADLRASCGTLVLIHDDENARTVSENGKHFST